jgi:hypothetical protein
MLHNGELSDHVVRPEGEVPFKKYGSEKFKTAVRIFVFKDFGIQVCDNLSTCK